MKILKIGNELEVSEIGMGCMRLTSLDGKRAVRNLIDTALDLEINFFDHADIYGGGKAEEIFGEAITSDMRKNMIIQSKCAIRPGCCYDFSKEYILASVDGILKRLKTDYLDILLLHRPDTLMDGEEIADAFHVLEESGKVRYFGVSNQNTMQLMLMNHYCNNKILIDQLQLSIAHCNIIDSGINVNIHSDAGANRDGGILEYCRLNNITIQAWSPFQYGMFEGCFISNDKYKELNNVLDRLSEKYHATANAIAIAWILRHPAKIQPIVGTTSEQRMKDICEASKISLTREEWYELYLAAGKILP